MGLSLGLELGGWFEAGWELGTTSGPTLWCSYEFFMAASLALTMCVSVVVFKSHL